MKKQIRETKKKSNLKRERSIKGIVTARKCPSCGHHEIGITTEKGDYLPLKPGMRIEVIKIGTRPIFRGLGIRLKD